MLLKIPELLSGPQVRGARERLEEAEWTDGNVTAGYQSSKAKNNLQLPEDSPAAREIGEEILRALGQNLLFRSAALPARIFPPLFNCYQGGRSFGTHVDNAIRHLPGSYVQVRTDLAMTLFFSEPEDYDGGELIVEDTFGNHRVKLEAGSAVLYPATSLHQVSPVTRGRRLASFFWIQSLISSDERRTLLFDLDMGIQQIRNRLDDSDEVLLLTNVYHNLMRQWAHPA